MAEDEKVFGDSFKDKLTILGYRAPWYLVISAYRLLYDFHLEGFENIPDEGPFITLVHEPSLIGVFAIGWIGIEVMLKVNLPKSIPSQGL